VKKLKDSQDDETKANGGKKVSMKEIKNKMIANPPPLEPEDFK
jgi:hypothetical protein